MQISIKNRNFIQESESFNKNVRKGSFNKFHLEEKIQQRCKKYALFELFCYYLFYSLNITSIFFKINSKDSRFLTVCRDNLHYLGAFNLKFVAFLSLNCLVLIIYFLTIFTYKSWSCFAVLILFQEEYIFIYTVFHNYNFFHNYKFLLQSYIFFKKLLCGL